MAVKKIFEQTAITDPSDYRFVVGKSGEEATRNVTYDNLKNSILADYYPSSGSFRSYNDVIPRSYCKEKAALIPLVDAEYETVELPFGRDFSSGELQIGEYYRVTGTGTITHYGFTFDAGEEFKAMNTDFTVSSGSPVIQLGTQHAEFEDCSQLYNPQVIEVGDYYYMYYAGNTQKYKNVGLVIDQAYGENIEGGITDVISGDTIQNNADYSRNDQVFLAYKHKSYGLYSGVWTKWKEGRQPVLSASGEHSGEDDASSAYLRSVFHDGTQYVMMYGGVPETAGTSHDATQMWATSTNGVTWTRQGTFTTPSGLNLGVMFYNNSAYYLLVYEGSSNALYKSTGDPTDPGTFAGSFSLLESTLISGVSIVYSVTKFNNKIYIGGRKISAGSDAIYLYECSDTGTDVETPGNWSETGLLYETPDSDSDVTGETVVDINSSTTANYHCILEVDSDKSQWAVFYSYYSDYYARYPFVPETGIRMLTFTNESEPIPST